MTPVDPMERALNAARSLLGGAVYIGLGIFVYTLMHGASPAMWADARLYAYAAAWPVVVLWYAFLYAMAVVILLGAAALLWSHARR